MAAFTEGTLGRLKESSMEYQDEFTRAKRLAGAKLAFYIHLMAYVAVNALLIVINLAASTRHLWFMWPLLGWGIGVFVHAVVTFALPTVQGVKRRMIEKEMRKKP